MISYGLEKLSAEHALEPQEEGQGVLSKVMAALGVSAGASFLTSTGIDGLRKAMDSSIDSSKGLGLDKLTEIVSKQNDSKLIIINQLEKDMDSFYQPDSHAVVVKNKPNEAILRHELGHAKTYKSLGKNSDLAVSARTFGSNVGSGVGVAALLLGDQEIKEKAYLAPLIGGIPTFLDEGIATGRAVKGLVNSHGFRKGLRKALPLVPGGLSYLAPTIALYVAGQAYAPVRDALKEILDD